LDPQVAARVFNPDNGLSPSGGGGGTHVVNMVDYGALVAGLVTVPDGSSTSVIKAVKKVWVSHLDFRRKLHISVWQKVYQKKGLCFGGRIKILNFFIKKDKNEFLLRKPIQ
jgi:hypothetical protein